MKNVFKGQYPESRLEFECYTFDRYFCDYYGRDITNLKDKTIFIEEYSMTPNRWMTKMYHAFTKFGSTIYMFGDTNQCDPVEKPSKIYYTVSIKQMCPGRIEMKYIEGEKSRYDIPTKNMLTEFLNTGTISHKFPPTKTSYHNICYLNETRRGVTEACCNRFTKDKDYYEIKFKYQGKKEQYKGAVGMQFLAKQEVFNMMEFKLTNIDHDAKGNLLFMFGDKVFEHNVFAESFIPAFCVTVYKYQGGTINKPYNIFDVEKMDKKQLYAALSRTTNLEYIQLSSRKLKHKYENPPFINMETINSYFNDYHNGQIYAITFQHNDKIYVGGSIRNLQDRLKEHMTDSKSPIYKYRNDNPTIRSIMLAPCKDRTEFNKVEAEYIISYSEKYGSRTLNKQHAKKENEEIKYQHQAYIESENELKERLHQKFGDKLKIKDDPMQKLLYYDTKIDGKRYKTMARYNKCSKEKAMSKITKKQQQLIDELTINFN